MSEEEYNAKLEEGKSSDWLGEGAVGIQSPYRGQWWRAFYEGVAADVGRWENVRGVMARGKCRVVVRYSEFDGLEAQAGGEFGEEKGLLGLGIEFEGGGGGRGRRLKRGWWGEER